MQLDHTQVTVDKTKDPFKDYGLAIVGNIVSYSSSSKEEEEEIKVASLKKDLGASIIVEEAKVTTPTSTPITPTPIVTISPSTPSVHIVQAPSDDESKA